ncbi:MAG: hypothetical protein J2P25_08610, partial [Nocardiopsaceae bacterium]|nr:hypothetical protein [Nocardiopsaceae bacterium]
MNRRSSRSDRRDGATGSGGTRGGRDYDDDYEYDDYQQDDDAWSPDEYFSPEGVRGRWASDSSRPSAGRGGRYGSPGEDYDGDGYGPGAGYDTGGFDSGGFDSGEYAYGDYPDGYQDYGDDGYEADGDAPARRGGRRRRTDKADKGERGLRRLVRRGERDADIWPDDGVSDEEYWASVAADKPLPTAEPEDSTQVMTAKHAGSPLGSRASAGPGAAGRSGPGRLGPAPSSAP